MIYKVNYPDIGTFRVLQRSCLGYDSEEKAQNS